MSRRIEIELTSSKDDGSWTWRAAGAKQPKGVLDASVLYPGAKAGDVMRAEAEFEIEGITILSVIPPKAKATEPHRLEVVGSGRDPGPGVTTSLVSKGRRDRDDRPRDSRDRPGRDESRGPRPEGRSPRPDRTGAPGEHRARPEGVRGERRPTQGDGARRGPGRETESVRRRPEGAGAGRPDSPGRARHESAGENGPRRPGGAGSSRPAPKRLTPGTKYRDAVLETVEPEHHPIAQQVLRGGMPAVRQALAAENERAKSEGRPQASNDPILAIAEGLLPRLKTAEWRDRAEAATAMGDDVSIRDLRSVVAGAEAAARDDDTRMLASSLREALHRRLEAQRTSWVTEITTNLDEGKVMRSLRVTARPPDPGVRLPADVAVKLAEAAGAAMSSDVPADRWAALLEAVVGSPVRRSVKPAGLPTDSPPELLNAARHAAGQVPALAPLLGLSMPPAPGPARPRSLTTRAGGPRSRSAVRPVPPPPARRVPPTVPEAAGFSSPPPDGATSTPEPPGAPGESAGLLPQVEAAATGTPEAELAVAEAFAALPVAGEADKAVSETGSEETGAD